MCNILMNGERLLRNKDDYLLLIDSHTGWFIGILDIKIENRCAHFELCSKSDEGVNKYRVITSRSNIDLRVCKSDGQFAIKLHGKVYRLGSLSTVRRLAEKRCTCVGQ